MEATLEQRGQGDISPYLLDPHSFHSTELTGKTEQVLVHQQAAKESLALVPRGRVSCYCFCDPGKSHGSFVIFFNSSLPALVAQMWRCRMHTDTKWPVETNRFTLCLLKKSSPTPVLNNSYSRPLSP